MKPKLIYICGMGHNGSTILNLALDLSKQVIATSQLNELLNPYAPNSVKQSEKTNLEHFWIDILDDLSESEKKALKNANHSTRGERNILSMFLFRGSRKRLSDPNTKIVQSIFAKTGNRVVVDSSKNVSRAIALSECNEIDVYFLHLIRDVRGLVNSSNKRAIEKSKPNKYLLPTLHWLFKNASASLLLRMRADKMMKVHYEEIVLEPDKFMDRLESFVGEKFPQTRSALRGEIDIDQSTVGFSGNRVLKKKKNRFRTGQMSVDGTYQSIRYWYSLGWLSKFWGYRRDVRPNQQQTADH